MVRRGSVRVVNGTGVLRSAERVMEDLLSQRRVGQSFELSEVELDPRARTAEAQTETRSAKKQKQDRERGSRINLAKESEK